MTSRRIAALILLAAVPVTVLAGCGGVGARLTFNDTEKVKVTEIVLTGASGDVRVRTAPIAETRINRVIHRNSDPGQTYRLDGTVLHLDTDCGRDCSVSYDIEAPAGVAVRGELKSGDIGLDGVGSADVALTSGDVAIRNAAGAVKVRATSGDVTVMDGKGGATIDVTSGDVRAMNISGGPVTARASSGEVHVKLAAANSVTARTGSGDVTVIVPPGSYRVTADTGSGEDRITGIVSDPSAQHVINVQTGSGDATVTGEPSA